VLSVQLVASDLDGTLLRTGGSLSEYSHGVLRRLRASGVQLVLVTGRPVRLVRDLAHSLALDSAVICGNGAVLYDARKDEILEQFPIAAEMTREIIMRLRRDFPDVAFAVESGLEVTREAAYVRHSRKLGAAQREVADALELCAQGASKLIALHPGMPLDQFLARARDLISELAHVTHAGAPFIEISAIGVTKAWALARYCERQGVLPADVIAFGDMPNDLPMLEWAGHSVAVANAHSTVLAIAQHQTASNDDDGVALFIERELLGRNAPSARADVP
jgi:Cof subfamily protein (haloacid dehalogenase superfamily)